MLTDINVVPPPILFPNRKLSAGFKRFYETPLSTTLDQMKEASPQID
jgi:hypothetical protein